MRAASMNFSIQDVKMFLYDNLLPHCASHICGYMVSSPPVWSPGASVKLPLHTGLRLKIGVLIDGIVDQQLTRGFEKPFDMQDFVKVSFLPMRLFELNCRYMKLLFTRIP